MASLPSYAYASALSYRRQQTPSDWRMCTVHQPLVDCSIERISLYQVSPMEALFGLAVLPSKLAVPTARHKSSPMKPDATVRAC
jgi:hypothetical protein